jgi:hypothetical protein
MPDHIPYTGTDFLVHERANGIRFAAHGLHGVPKHEDEAGHPGRLGRARATLGRRLISLGSAVAGHHESAGMA